MRRDADGEALREGAGDLVAQLPEASEGGIGVVAEDLQVHDPGEAEVGGGDGGCAGEAGVADRRDPRA